MNKVGSKIVIFIDHLLDDLDLTFIHNIPMISAVTIHIMTTTSTSTTHNMMIMVTTEYINNNITHGVLLGEKVGGLVVGVGTNIKYVKDGQTII